MAKIFVYGNATLDIILTTPHAPMVDDEVRAIKKRHSRGGNGANTACLLSEMGHEVHFAGIVANDDHGQLIINNLVSHQINLDAVEQVKGQSSPTSYISLSQTDGSRTIIHYRNLPEMGFESIASTPFSEFDWLHFEGRNIDVLEAIIIYARSFLSDQPISIEIEKPRNDIEKLIPFVDVAMFSRNYAIAKGFEDGTSFLSHIQTTYPNLAMASVTWGEQGAFGVYKNNPPFFVAVKPVTAIDTIGAGDTFNAAFIDALVSRQPFEKALELASAFATKKVTQHGFDGLISTPNNHEGILLCRLDELDDELGAKGFDLEEASIFIVKYNDTVKGYLNKCPHIQIELNFMPDVFTNIEKTHIQCAQHMAMFEPETGECIAGPCVGQSLTPIKISVKSGQIYYHPEPL